MDAVKIINNANLRMDVGDLTRKQYENLIAPLRDVEVVRHGRWVMKEGELAFWDKCSECGKQILHRTPYYDFCPNCGANMRKDGGNGRS